MQAAASRRRVYLMRHGSVSYFDAAGRPLDPRTVPLTEAGRQQAQAAARALAEVSFDLAFCSGMPRTRETAQIVLGARDVPLQEEPRLKEVKAGRLGEVPAQVREQVIAYAYDGAEGPEAGFIGGERWIDFRQRVLAAWQELIARPDWNSLLLVAHDAVNRVLLSHLAGSGLSSLKAFEQDPACINVIDVDVAGGELHRAFLRTVNLAPYDPIRSSMGLTVMERLFREYQPKSTEPGVTP